MSDKLQQAIAATRAGQNKDAQLLLAEAIEENPNNEHAWFLLGNLVESPEKRMAYLGKAVAINPQFAKAKQQLAQVQRQVVASSMIPVRKAVVADEPLAFEEVFEEVDEALFEEAVAELPDWLAEDEAVATTEAELEVEAIGATVAANEEEVALAVVDEKKKGVTAVAPPTALAKADNSRQLQRYNYALAFISILIIVVLFLLITSL